MDCYFDRYLSNGDSFKSLKLRFRLGLATVHKAIKETCEVIWDVLQPMYMPVPTRKTWEETEKGFWQRWNFPNCCGALDGKHCVITCPAKSGTLYYNYKGTYSLNLMALVDWNYKFICIDVGAYGSNADSPVFSMSDFGDRWLDYDLDVPPPKPLPGAPELGALPHVIVADAAFPLRPNIMRPYPNPKTGHIAREKDIFNYRQSRARKIVENAFGILAQRFRIFNRRMHLGPKNAVRVIKACCILHNFLRDRKDIPNTYAQLNPNHEPYLSEDGAIIDLERLNGYRSTEEARRIRDKFCKYFNSPAGSVHWQDKYRHQ